MTDNHESSLQPVELTLPMGDLPDSITINGICYRRVHSNINEIYPTRLVLHDRDGNPWMLSVSEQGALSVQAAPSERRSRDHERALAALRHIARTRLPEEE